MKELFLRSYFAFLLGVLLTTIIIVCNVAFAAEVTLNWDANTEPDLVGYKVSFGTASREYVEPKDVGNVTEYTLTVPDDITHFFAVTAYDTEELESDYSDEATCINNLPPGTVINLIINCK